MSEKAVNLPEKKEVSLAEIDQPKSIAQALIQMVQNPNIDPDRLERLLDVHIKLSDREAEQAFNAALAGFQGDCPIIKRTKRVNFKSVDYKYSPVEEVVKQIKSHLTRWGLSYSFNVRKTEDPNLHELVTNISHVDGHSKEFSHFFNPIHNDDRMNDSQRIKSSITFAKRVGLESALGIVTEEDDKDGNLPAVPITKEQIKEIRSLIDSTGADPERFFLYLGVATKKIEELNNYDAQKAIHALKQKQQKMGAQ